MTLEIGLPCSLELSAGKLENGPREVKDSHMGRSSNSTCHIPSASARAQAGTLATCGPRVLKERTVAHSQGLRKAGGEQTPSGHRRGCRTLFQGHYERL